MQFLPMGNLCNRVEPVIGVECQPSLAINGYLFQWIYVQRSGCSRKCIGVSAIPAGSRMPELSVVSRRGLGIKRILNDYLYSVDPKALIGQGLLQKLKVVLQIGFYIA